MKTLVAFASLWFATAGQTAVVVPQAGSYEVLIPAAASTPGANGTFFRSDIALVNLAPRDQVVRLEWLPQGGGAVGTTMITLGPNSGIRSADFVATQLERSGLGSILITGINSAGLSDLNAKLFVSVRIWSPQPGSAGTTSQSLPGIPTSAIDTQSAVLYAVGGADNALNYRTNVGIVNLDPTNAQSFRIAMPAPLGPGVPSIDVTVPPMSMQQVAIGNVSSSQKITIDNTTATGKSNVWLAYGSSVDNVTGDAWSELAVAATTQ
jgi:hypothetical protein